ncbi:MAG: glucose-6-phosphate isomerase, partial [Pseudomonadota bacterium]
MTPERTGSWKKLTALASEQVRSEPEAATPLTVEAAGLQGDLTKQRLSAEVISTLIALAEERELAQAIDDQFAGAIVNGTEGRPALHSALRAPAAEVPAVAKDAAAVMDKVLALAESLRNGRWRGATGRTITDVVHIGIGGSHLGPELVVDALRTRAEQSPAIHFVANIDGEALDTALAVRDPERTLFVIVSKSFSTLETRVNAATARSWFLERTGSLEAIGRHFIAISTNLEAADEFGIPAENVFPMWDWVGGRYSVWSPVGLPLAIALGRKGFDAFLAGGHALDRHFRSAPFAENLPVLMALAGIWNYNFLGVTNQAIL